jgi:hypothetical protein
VIPSHKGEFSEELAIQNGYSSEQAVFLRRLCSDYQDFRFRMGRKFAFRPPKTIIIGPPEPFAELLALHEVSHAICEHKDFRMDVERLKMEVQAWEKARELAARYNVDYNEELVQRELDTYRDWLHQKSRCPICGLTRFQTPDGKYHCPSCEAFKQLS